MLQVSGRKSSKQEAAEEAGVSGEGVEARAAARGSLWETFGGGTVMQRGWRHAGPLRWLRDVGAEVQVRTGTGEELRGRLLTVDPVSAR